MPMKYFAVISACLLCATQALSQAHGWLQPVGAELVTENLTDTGQYMLPNAPFADGAMVTQEISGSIMRQIWRIDSTTATTEQIMAPLRNAIEEADMSIRLDCLSAACGGFDFRFGTEVLPAPHMYVDLADFRFLSATGEGGTPAGISILVSRTETVGLVQIIQVNETSEEPSSVEGSLVSLVGEEDPEIVLAGEPTPVELGYAELLVAAGHVVLGDLKFATGTTNLEDSDYPSLEELATWLLANPDQRITLVGHTDNVGALKDNIALSRARATTAMDYLVGKYGIKPDQVLAEGVGYLSPIAPNATAEDRARNRRVEAVLMQ